MKCAPIALLVASSLTLVGCVTAPLVRDDVLAITPPERWSASDAPAGEPDSTWWIEFDDPRLVRLIELALQRNHDLQAAAARLDQAAAAARIAGAELKPSLSIGLDVARQKNNFVTFGAAIPSRTLTTYGVNIATSWEADLWGRLRAGARAGLAEFQAAGAQYRAAQLSLAAQTARVWFTVLEARTQLRLATDSTRAFRATADQVGLRYESGLRPALDLRLARSNLSAAQALAASRRTQLDAATRQLEVLLGRYPAGGLGTEFDGNSLPDTPPPIPAGLPADLIARRPDLAAAERRLAAADQRVLAARRALYPRLSLTGSAGTVSTELSDLLDGDFGQWNLAANLLQPLFQGGRLRAGVESAGAISNELLASYRGTALRAFAEVESALAAEQHLADREQHLLDTVDELSAARRLADERYASGVGVFLAVLESQTRELTARGELTAVRRQRLDNRVSLHLALGGGFDEETR